jgi:hypothetical protein
MVAVRAETRPNVARFYLGTHVPRWLEYVDVPLFVSYRTLREIKGKLPRALQPWGEDSCGFTELMKFGRWTIDENKYIEAVRKHSEHIGNLEFAAIQDWMCEPQIIHGNKQKKFVGTHLSVAKHQELTIDSWERLNEKAPELPWMPVLQGWEAEDYIAHMEMYKARGHDLTRQKIVGVGSVCRRQGTEEGANIIRTVYQLGVKIHAFGFKTDGLMRIVDLIESSDSLAWSYGAYKGKERLGRCKTHKNCANCEYYALLWRQKILDKLDTRKVEF